MFFLFLDMIFFLSVNSNVRYHTDWLAYGEPSLHP